jgi:geranylgeranyl diphosphate synthase type I
MSASAPPGHEVLGALRAVVDEVLERHLAECSADLARRDVLAGVLVEEISRLIRAGGKRLRPAFCYWGYRAAGGAAPDEPHFDDPIVRAASALELLHTMALIHDDLIDEATERRGVPSSASQLAAVAAERGMPVDHRRFGRSAALLAGDLAAVLADRLLLTSGFDAPAIARALVPYHEMRLDMAAGQVLEITGAVGGSAERPTDGPGPAATAARLKGGSYTVEGPLLVGAALAGGSDDVGRALRAFGEPLGEAFQLRDDLLDADAPPGVTTSDVNWLVERARAVLREAPIEPDAAAGLDRLASLVAMP